MSNMPSGAYPLNRSFDKLFQRIFDSPRAGRGRMDVDVRENDYAYLVKTMLPGVVKEAIRLRVDGNTVSISVEGVGGDTAVVAPARLAARRPVGQSRHLHFSQEIDGARASAEYGDGVLELTLPKKAEPYGFDH